MRLWLASWTNHMMSPYADLMSRLKAIEPSSLDSQRKLLIVGTCSRQLQLAIHIPENKPPPLFDLQFFAQVYYKSPPICCKNCTVSKNELMIDKSAVICSLNGLSSSYVSCFC